MITTQQKMNLKVSTTKLNDYLKNTFNQSVVCTQKMELIEEQLTHQTFPINEINDSYGSETRILIESNIL